MKSLSMILFFVFLILGGAQAETSGRAWVSKNPIYLAESFQYHIELESDQKGQGELPYTLTSLGVFEPASFEYGEVIEKEGKFTQRFTFELNSFLSGKYNLPPQIVYWKLGDSLLWTDTLEAVPIEVLSNIKTDMKDIHEAEDIIAAPFNYMPWLIGALIAVALGVLIYLLTQKKAKQLAEKKLSPYEVARQQLDQLLTLNLLSSEKVEDRVNHFAELAQIFRTYLEGELEVEALESTSSELISKLKRNSQYPNQLSEDTKRFLSLADQAKFAKADNAIDEGEFALGFVEKVLGQVRRPLEDK